MKRLKELRYFTLIMLLFGFITAGTLSSCREQKKTENTEQQAEEEHPEGEEEHPAEEKDSVGEEHPEDKDSVPE